MYGWKHAGYIPDLTPQEKRASWLFSGRLARADGAVETEKDQERLGKSGRSLGLGQIRSRLHCDGALEPWFVWGNHPQMALIQIIQVREIR